MEKLSKKDNRTRDKQSLFERWGLNDVELKLGVVNFKFKNESESQEVAWELYIELITRIATQSLLPDVGENRRALESLYELFKIIRNI